jgi:hypothetical protein
MSLVLGLDMGTTTLTALALDAADGTIAACTTIANDAEVTSAADRIRGYSEWDVQTIAHAACRCLHATAEQLGSHRAEVVGLGVTDSVLDARSGQEHNTGCPVVGAPCSVLLDRSAELAEREQRDLLRRFPAPSRQLEGVWRHKRREEGYPS